MRFDEDILLKIWGIIGKPRPDMEDDESTRIHPLLLLKIQNVINEYDDETEILSQIELRYHEMYILQVKHVELYAILGSDTFAYKGQKLSQIVDDIDRWLLSYTEYPEAILRILNGENEKAVAFDYDLVQL